jgi:hypothetical protein
MQRGRNLGAIVTALLFVGCSGLAGLDDLRFGAAEGPGGAGGAGGAATTASVGGGGTGGGTSGAGGGGGSPFSCGKASAFADDFSDGVRHPFWNEDESPVESGELVLTPKNDGTSSTVAYYAYSTLDLTDDAIYVEVPEVAAGAGTDTSIVLRIDGSSDLTIEHIDGELRFELEKGNVEDPVAVSYDAVAHRWWRIRETAGTLFWETSPDALSWTTQRQMQTQLLFSVRHVFVILRAKTDGSSSPGTARFDNLNGGVASGAFCSASSVSDDFNSGNYPQPDWKAESTSDCAATLAGDALRFEVTGTDFDHCDYESRAVHDFTDSAISVELLEAPTSGGAFAWLSVDNRSTPGAADTAAMEVADGELYARVPPGRLATVAYDPVEHRWLRMRESGGLLYWETSPDGSAWNELHVAASPFDLSAVELELGLQASPGDTVPAVARFDNLNVAP